MHFMMSLKNKYFMNSSLFWLCFIFSVPTFPIYWRKTLLSTTAKSRSTHIKNSSVLYTVKTVCSHSVVQCKHDNPKSEQRNLVLALTRNNMQNKNLFFLPEKKWTKAFCYLSYWEFKEIFCNFSAVGFATVSFIIRYILEFNFSFLKIKYLHTLITYAYKIQNKRNNFS